MAFALSTGCSQDALDELGSEQQSLRSGTGYYNGQGVYVSLEDSSNDFGMAPSIGDWHMLGFVNSSNPSKVYATFMKTDPTTGDDSTGQTLVSTATQGSKTFDVLQVEAGNATLGATNIQIDLHDRSTAPSSPPVKLSGSALENLVLQITFPSGGPSGTFYLRLHAPVTLTSNGTTTLYGYNLDFWNSSNPSKIGGYCHTTDANIESVTFLSGVAIHPLKGQRVVNSNAVLLSCASGTISACMVWGYKPWETSADAHQTCIQMKRAAYCNDYAYTNYGHMIYVNDKLSPQMNNSFGTTNEAFWGPAGAVCFDNQRDPDIAFSGCSNPLPSCSGFSSGWMEQSSF